MVSHGRQKKDKPRKPKRGKNIEDTSNNDDFHDMDLPEDFSIAGVSSINSDFNSINDFDDDVDDALDNDIDASEARAEIRQSKLLDALSLASTLSSEKRSAKREAVSRYTRTFCLDNTHSIIGSLLTFPNFYLYECLGLQSNI